MAESLMLALETSGLRGSVALARGEELIAFRWLTAERTHTSELFPFAQELFAEAGVRAAEVGVYAYSSGPGSFTGLRIAATVGRMLQSATGCEVVAVSTLEVIARNTLRHPDAPPRVAAILDAKRGQVYGAVFERHSERQLHTTVEPGLYDPMVWLARITRPLAIVGDGITRHRDVCESSGARILEPEYWPPSGEHVAAIATRMAEAGRFCTPEEIVPLYLRPPECEEVYESRRAAARRRRGE